jgi:hypothetical protein
MGEHEARIARNEALFREVNERVRGLADDPAGREAEPMAFVCECGRLDCAESIDLSLAEYEHVRSHPAQFVVVSGHEAPQVEEVVERHEGYYIVRKHSEEAQIALETDPRLGPREQAPVSGERGENGIDVLG